MWWTRFWVLVVLRTAIIAVWSSQRSVDWWVGADPVEARGFANGSALPGVVTWVWPSGSFQMTVASDDFLGYRLRSALIRWPVIMAACPDPGWLVRQE